MKNKIKFLAMFLCVITLFSLFAAGCSFSSTKKIGVSMPSKNLQRWNQDGENIKIQLQAKGYEVNLQFSNDDIGEQIEQIDSMIEDGCKVLVIAAIDGPALKDVLKKAADKKIKIDKKL